MLPKIFTKLLKRIKLANITNIISVLILNIDNSFFCLKYVHVFIVFFIGKQIKMFNSFCLRSSEYVNCVLLPHPIQVINLDDGTTLVVCVLFKSPRWSVARPPGPPQDHPQKSSGPRPAEARNVFILLCPQGEDSGR